MAGRIAWWMVGMGLALVAVGMAQTTQQTTQPGAVPLTTTAPATGSWVNPDPQRYMFEDQIKPGMKGYGLTIIHGTKIERFEFVVVDVVGNLGAGTNAILIKCSGLGLEVSGPVAGMSGSPCYIEGKMIGAFAFGWPGSKEPIAGVQPIRQMLNIKPPVAPGAPVAPVAPMATGRWGQTTGLGALARATPGWSKLTAGWRGSAGVAAGVPTGLTRLQIPMTVSDASASAWLGTALKDSPWQVMNAGAGASSQPAVGLGGRGETVVEQVRLEPGAAVAVALVRGDMDMSGIGTVTEVRDNKVYAFGHAFEASGPVALPMATAYIYTVIPTLGVSFKMGSSLAPQGALVNDEQTGILGLTDQVATTIPVKVKVRSEDGRVARDFSYQVAKHPGMLPELLGAVLQASMMQQRTPGREFTLTIAAKTEYETFAVDQQWLGTNTGGMPQEVVLPVAALADNPWQRAFPKAVSYEVTIKAGNDAATLNRVLLTQASVKPGGVLKGTLEWLPAQGVTFTTPWQFTVPAQLPPGDYQMQVSAADVMMQSDQAVQGHLLDPRSEAQLRKSVAHLAGYRRDRVYTRLVGPNRGFVVEGRAVMVQGMEAAALQRKLGPAAQTLPTVYEHSAAMTVPVFGGAAFTVRVSHQPEDRYVAKDLPTVINATGGMPVKEPQPVAPVVVPPEGP